MDSKCREGTGEALSIGKCESSPPRAAPKQIIESYGLSTVIPSMQLRLCWNDDCLCHRYSSQFFINCFGPGRKPETLVAAVGFIATYASMA